MNSLLQLNMQLIDIHLLKIDFSLNKDFKVDGENKEVTFNPTIGSRYDFKNDTNELVVFIRLSQKNGDVPYFFEVEVGGLFKFKETPDPKILETFSTINCPAIVFPYIRETVADITRRAGFPSLHVGPINFIELAKRNKEKNPTT